MNTTSFKSIIICRKIPCKGGYFVVGQVFHGSKHYFCRLRGLSIAEFDLIYTEMPVWPKVDCSDGERY